MDFEEIVLANKCVNSLSAYSVFVPDKDNARDMRCVMSAIILIDKSLCWLLKCIQPSRRGSRLISYSWKNQEQIKQIALTAYETWSQKNV